MPQVSFTSGNFSVWLVPQLLFDMKAHWANFRRSSFEVKCNFKKYLNCLLHHSLISTNKKVWFFQVLKKKKKTRSQKGELGHKHIFITSNTAIQLADLIQFFEKPFSFIGISSLSVEDQHPPTLLIEGFFFSVKLLWEDSSFFL